MKLADLLLRVWQRDPIRNDVEAPGRAMSNRDSTSMADFVRILQEEDRKSPRADTGAR
jgi:hypothetical protein